MKKRAAAAATKSLTNANSLLSPLPISSPERSSKPTKPYDFDLNTLRTSSKKTLDPSPVLHPLTSPPQKTLATISDLKNLVSSHTDSLKRQVDHCHSETLKEIDASKTRISKRFKVQTHACMQLTEEAEKEYKKMSDRISENTELIKASYVEFITEAQATAYRVCKVSIPELAQSLEKAIEGLRSRYRIPSTPV